MRPQSTPSALAAAVDAWIAQNPLAQWRKREGLSRARAAALLGVSAPTLLAWENGSYRPGRLPQQAIAAALDLSVADADRVWKAWEAKQPHLPRRVRNAAVAGS